MSATSVPAVEFLEVGKSFGTLRANHGISFSVRAGEIHAVVGENGAGKSTLMGILSGFLKPDSGEVRLHGRPLRTGSPAAALDAGVGLCAQHFHLVPGLTGMENILLAARGRGVGRGSGRRSRVRALMEQYGLQTELEVPVCDLSVGEQERVEILKLLHRESRILILDEPTAVLAPSEVEALFDVLRKLASEGCAVLFVSHKLPEVLALAHRVTVLRSGRVVGTMDLSTPPGPDSAHRVGTMDPSATAETVHRVGTMDPSAAAETARLVAMIVGGVLPPELRWTPSSPGEPVLEAEDLAAGGGGGRLRGLSFSVRAGEIVGIGGVEGNGQRELIRSLLGALPLESGRVRFHGRVVDPRRPESFRRHVGCIPADRLHEGLLPDLDLVENLALGRQQEPGFRKGILLDRAALRRAAAGVVDRFRVTPARLDVRARNLSGGNQQRFIAGREIQRSPRLLLAVHPTRGVDILATRFLHEQLLAERDRGAAILLISADLGELQALSDRLIVLYRGRAAYRAEREDVVPERLHASLLGLEGSGERDGGSLHGLESSGERDGA